MSPPFTRVNGGGKVGHLGGLNVDIAAFENRTPSDVFYKVDYQPVEGEMDESSEPVSKVRTAYGMRHHL